MMSQFHNLQDGIHTNISKTADPTLNAPKKIGQFKLQCIEEVPTPGPKTLIKNQNSMAMQQIQD
jgi:hypothetical protein